MSNFGGDSNCMITSPNPLQRGRNTQKAVFPLRRRSATGGQGGGKILSII